MASPYPDVDVPALLARLGARPHRITADSRRVAAGDAFAAFPGMKSDGRAFIADALARGTGAVLWEPEGFQSMRSSCPSTKALRAESRKRRAPVTEGASSATPSATCPR